MGIIPPPLFQIPVLKKPRIPQICNYFTHFDAHLVNMQANTKINKWNIFIIIDDHKAQ